METIANRIKQGLAIRNMKQADLVEKTKIGKSSISTYISGAYEPKQRNIYKIAQALDVNEAWLMGHDVPMEREISTNNMNIDLNDRENLLLNNFNKLNELGKLKLIEYSNDLIETPKYIEENKKIIELPKKEKQIWEESGKEHLMPIACHDDNLTDEEKAIVNEKINEILNNLDKY
ncbi:helix-turn-helix domain-containing protein [Clostridium nigeriense]|uniref:helix-turn-helix domain-containing protein n=1 Tax=Clostridium nigeriense TaxID=1805470 RepID=UPI003D3577FB